MRVGAPSRRPASRLDRKRKEPFPDHLRSMSSSFLYICCFAADGEKRNCKTLSCIEEILLLLKTKHICVHVASQYLKFLASGLATCYVLRPFAS